ncbi:MAG: hypothetical protein EP326_16120, partial [Deltaproteobacteria bacterium]
MSKTFGCLFITLLTLISLRSEAKPHMVAEVGRLSCLEKTTPSSKFFSDLSITLSNANKTEQSFIADTFETIIRMTNQQQAERLLSGLKIKIQNTLGDRSSGGCLPAHQLVRNEIHLARKCEKIGEIPFREGIFVHELGHFIANKLNLYNKYQNEVLKRCKLTNYMSKSRAGKKHKNRNEEFAEIFAAYLLYGKELKSKCKHSYEFI